MYSHCASRMNYKLNYVSKAFSIRFNKQCFVTQAQGSLYVSKEEGAG